MISAYKFGLFGEEKVDIDDDEMNILSDTTSDQFDYDGELYSIHCKI